MLQLRPLHSTDHAGTEPCIKRAARGANTEQVLILYDVTTKVLVKCCIVLFLCDVTTELLLDGSYKDRISKVPQVKQH